MDEAQQRRRRLAQLRERFIGASLRTRSLRMRRTTRSGALDLSRLHRKDAEALAGLVERLGSASGAPVALCDVRPSDQLETFVDDVSVLAHAAREERLESGSDDLAVGWPFIEGATRDGTWIRAPIFLFPASLRTSQTGRMQWLLEPTGPAEVNEALVELLVREEAVRLTREELLGEREAAPDDETWGRLIASIKRLGVALDAAPNLPALAEVEARSRDDTEAARPASLALRHHLVLGRFSVSSSNVIVDYDAMLERDLDAAELGLAAELLEVDEDTPWEEHAPLEDRDESPDKSIIGPWRRWQAFASDVSQDAVFRFLERTDERAGLVVQGPPGTGKSQLIANLVGAAVARDRRVLVVCPKRAALDVVATRLEAIGMGEPLAVVHDVRRDRDAVCAAIEATLGRLEDHLAGADARQRQIERARREHRQAANRLTSRIEHSRRAFELLAERDGKPPLAELFERALDDDGRPLPDMQPVADEVDEDELYEFLPRVETLAVDTAALAKPHPLAARGDWSSFEADDFEELFEQLGELCELVEQAQGLADATMTPAESAEHEALWSDAAPLVDMLEYERALLDEFVLFWTWTEGRTETGQWHQVMQTLEEARRELAFTPYELLLADRATLERWLEELAELAELRTKWFRFFTPRFWRLRKLPAEILDRCNSLGRAESMGLVDVEALCREAIGWQELIAEMPGDNPLFDFGFSGQPDDIDMAIESLRRQHTYTRCLHELHGGLAERGDPYAELPDLGPQLGAPGRDVQTFRAAVADRALLRLRAQLRESLDELAGAGLDAWVCAELCRAFDRADYDALVQTLEALVDARDEVDRAAEVDRLMDGLPGWARYFLKRWRPGDGPWSAGDDATLAVERGWRAHMVAGRSADEIEAPLVDDAYRKRLRDDLQQCRELAGEGIHGQWVERVAAAAGDERRRALQQLAAEVAKRRNKPRLRQLTERFWGRGLALVRPVWFCSPEAVSTLFALEPDIFDLVIFDEASQCRVESAIPALVRSQAAIIAGDDQQMPPSRFFEAGFEAEDDQSTLLGTRSVLQLARAVFTNTTLRWHYRSRHEELIAFSNRAFYGGRLITAPAAQRLAPDIDGLHRLRVDGLWQEQQNRAEAEAVVDLVARLLQSELDDGPPSVGVVTFNRKQAELVELLLESRAANSDAFRRAWRRDDARPIVDRLFVRNLENVQGDERDVIIMSPGYGPGEPGGPVHARFGPISMEGGEKRLNVAITRARQGLWLVTSMDVGQLEVDHTTHVGPKLLRAYFGFVEAHSGSDEQAAARWLEEAASLGGGRGVTGRSRRDRRDSGAPGSRVRRELARALSARGLHVAEDVGLGSHRLDLVVQHATDDEPARLGVDCTSFLSNPDTLSRDVHGPAFWSRLGWTVLRVSPSMWLRRREATVSMIVGALEEVSSAREALLEV